MKSFHVSVALVFAWWAVASGAAAAAPAQPATLPSMTTAGARRCHLGTEIPLATESKPRSPLLAFHETDGLAVWLSASGDRLVARPLKKDGTPAGEAARFELPGASVLDALVAVPDQFVLLFRADGSNGDLGSPTQTDTRLVVLDRKGAPIIAPQSFGSGRWRDPPYLRWRRGELQLFISRSTASSFSTRLAKVSPQTLEATYADAPEGWYTSALGPYWRDEKEVQVWVETGPQHGDESPHWMLVRTHGADELGREELPMRQLDFYEVRDTGEGKEIVLDNAFVKPEPHVGWNGSRFFVTTVHPRGDAYDSALLAISCAK